MKQQPTDGLFNLKTEGRGNSWPLALCRTSPCPGVVFTEVNRTLCLYNLEAVVSGFYDLWTKRESLLFPAILLK